MAFDSVVAKGSRAIQPNRPEPGRIITSAPASPSSTSAQRSRVTRSCNTTQASRVVISGVNITIAVNSATGIWRSEMKASADENSSRLPRSN